MRIWNKFDGWKSKYGMNIELPDSDDDGWRALINRTLNWRGTEYDKKIRICGVGVRIRIKSIWIPNLYLYVKKMFYFSDWKMNKPLLKLIMASRKHRMRSTGYITFFRTWMVIFIYILVFPKISIVFSTFSLFSWGFLDFSLDDLEKKLK